MRIPSIIIWLLKKALSLIVKKKARSELISRCSEIRACSSVPFFSSAMEWLNGTALLVKLFRLLPYYIACTGYAIYRRSRPEIVWSFAIICYAFHIGSWHSWMKRKFSCMKQTKIFFLFLWISNRWLVKVDGRDDVGIWREDTVCLPAARLTRLLSDEFQIYFHVPILPLISSHFFPFFIRTEFFVYFLFWYFSPTGDWVSSLNGRLTLPSYPSFSFLNTAHIRNQSWKLCIQGNWCPVKKEVISIHISLKLKLAKNKKK